MVASVADEKVTNIWKKLLLRLKLQARNSLFWSLICKLKVNFVCQLIFWYFDNLGKVPCFSVLNFWHVNTLNSIWTRGQNGCIISWKMLIFCFLCQFFTHGMRMYNIIWTWCQYRCIISWKNHILVKTAPFEV